MSKDSDILLRDGAEGISAADAASVLMKRKWMVIGAMVIVPAIVGGVVSKEPKVYEATTTLVLDSTVPQYLGQSFKDVVDMESTWWSAQETLQTELRIIKSRSQALATAKALCDKKFGRNQEIALQRLIPGADCSATADLGKAAALIQAITRVEPQKESRIVNLVVDYNDPELAAVLANTEAQVYADRNLEHRLSQSEGAASWLGDEYGDLMSQLNEAEHALIEFKKKNNVVAVAIEDQQNDLSSQHKKLSDELNNVQIKLIALRAQREQYAALISDDPMNTIAPGGNADGTVVSKLKELYVDQYAKLVEIRGKYLDKHPTVVAQEARVNALRADLARESNLSAKSLDAQFQSLVRQERDLRSSLDGATHAALQLEQRAIEYNRLKRNFDRLAKLSEQVGGRERETSLAGHLKTNNVRVLDAALVPTRQIAPNVPRTVGIAAAVAFLLSIGLAFLLELLDRTVKSPEDVEKLTGLVFLGLVPRINPGDASDGHAVVPPKGVADLVKAGSKELYVIAHPKSAVAECCRAIRTNLLFMSPDKPAKTLMITSAGPQEGKTTTSVNLAVTLALSGLRVLLVDTDMRRPRLHKVFGIPASTDGLSRAIVGETDVLSIVRETGVPNLFLLPCGALPPNPAELLHAERFKRIVEELSNHYDRVIFDSPPVGAVTDAAILSRLTEGTILVAKGGKTSRDALKSAQRQLADGKVNILGCILNDMDVSKLGGYGYYYYSQYGRYYGSDDKTIKPGPIGDTGGGA